MADLADDPGAAVDIITGVRDGGTATAISLLCSEHGRVLESDKAA